MRGEQAMGDDFRDLFDAHPLPMWVYDRETLRVLDANEAALARFGRPRVEVVGRPIRELPLAGPREMAWRSSCACGQQAMVVGVYRQRLPEGEARRLEVTTCDVTFASRPAVLAVARDAGPDPVEERPAVSAELALRTLAALEACESLVTAVAGHGAVLTSHLGDHPLGRNVEQMQRAAQQAADAVREVLAGARPELAPDRSEPEDERAEGDRREPSGRGDEWGAATVLLVAEEDILRGVIRDLLEEYGYTVLEGDCGEDGLERASEAQRLDLLITETLLPDMSGLELAERLGADRPGLRVLYVSGSGAETVERPAPGGQALLRRPFTPDDLVRRVRESLAA